MTIQETLMLLFLCAFFVLGLLSAVYPLDDAKLIEKIEKGEYRGKISK